MLYIILLIRVLIFISIVCVFNTISNYLFIGGFCSKRRFNEQEAEEWWSQNKDKVYSKYIPPPPTKNTITGPSLTSPNAEENSEPLPSS